MQHRVYIALPISEGLTKLLLQFREKNKNLNVRWVPEVNFHITVVPPWYTEDLEKTAKDFEKFRTSTDKITLEFFETVVNPRGTVWAKAKPNETLTKLRDELIKFMQNGGEKIYIEKRPLQPHVTVARFKEDLPKFKNENLQWEENCQKIQLLESVLTNKGAIYTKIAEVNL